MRRPWQVWLLFAAGLAVVIPAMVWLSWQVLFLDQAEALSRRQAEREELIGRALWRMDSFVTPLLAREASRPESYYQTVIVTSSGTKAAAGERLKADLANGEEAIADSTDEFASPIQSLTPLLADPPQYVLLHFNWLPDNRVLSPQCPSPEDRSFACAQGVTEHALSVFETRRHQLEVASTNQQLLGLLPAESWPVSRWDYLSDITGGSEPSAINQPPVVSPFPTYQTAVSGSYDNDYAATQSLGNETSGVQAYSSPGQSNTFAGGRPAVISSDRESANVQSDPRSTSNLGGQDDRFGQRRVPAPTTPQESQLLSAEAVPQRSPRSQLSGSRNDFDQRNSAYQQFAQQSVENLKYRNPSKETAGSSEPTSVTHQEGAFRPVWVGGKLLFARRVQQGERNLVQGCWLDWNRLEALLRDEVSDILPNFLLVPVFDPQQAALNRVLATLPVQIEVPPLQPQSIQWSPVRLALVAAWAGLIFAALAAAITLQGMIVLNERRASFVSAVTHELRTPLTTFRMYAEMLAEGMVPEPERQQRYLNTLRTESDRLAHLVDNVLQYARLERGRPGKQRQKVSLAALLERMEVRLQERAEQAGLNLQLQGNVKANTIELVTDPSAIEQIVFNLVDNASKYAAEAEDKSLLLQWKLEPRALALRVIDRGPGIGAAGQTRLFQPFSKSVNEAAESAPGVGLGLALSRRLARALGGELSWEQTPGGGATFCLRLPRG